MPIPISSQFLDAFRELNTARFAMDVAVEKHNVLVRARATDIEISAAMRNLNAARAAHAAMFTKFQSIALE